MKGTVVDGSGNGIVDVVVILRDEANAALASLVLPVTTDTNGEYRFDSVPAGTCMLTFVTQGYLTPEPVTVKVVEGKTKTVPPVVMQEDTDGTQSSVYLPAIVR